MTNPPSAVIALRRSRKIKLPDAIVAATALAHGLRLLTLDQSLDRIFQALLLDAAGVKPKASN